MSGMRGPVDVSTVVDQLDRKGYAVVEGIVPAHVNDRVREICRSLVAEAIEGFEASLRAGRSIEWQERGVVRVADIEPHVFRCEDVINDHSLLETARRLTAGRDFRRSRLSLRAPLPGYGHQGLHRDGQGVAGPGSSEGPRGAEPWPSVNVLWCLVPFGHANGSLRVVPGSHRAETPPIEDHFGSAMGPHPDEVLVTASAGSLILFNGARLWHSGTFNYSNEPRLALLFGYRPRSAPQPRESGSERS